MSILTQATNQGNDSCGRIGDVGADIDEVLSAPPKRNRCGEVVPFFPTECYGKNNRNNDLKQATAQYRHETAEYPEKNVAKLMKG